MLINSSLAPPVTVVYILLVHERGLADLIPNIRSWASLLASESRDRNWIRDAYVMPAEVDHLSAQLRFLHGALIGLVGIQGVGKSSALLALSTGSPEPKTTEPQSSQTILFKWRRTSDLFRSLMQYDHEASVEFRSEYERKLEGLSIDRAEQVGGAKIVRLRKYVWQDLLRSKHTIFIDMPDYSKTDRRLMAKDLEEIYWLWNSLRLTNATTGPNLVIAIQKEMFSGHFFFDKMSMVELKPLQPSEIVEAYLRQFKTIDPFTDDSLLTVARMSRGVFRRFLRYISLTLDLWSTESQQSRSIDTTTVKKAVTAERLAEDMELEFVELFPRHSDLRLQAVRLLTHLEESGPMRQSRLGELLGIEPYAMSRLLAKLELHRYVVREREGADKLVGLASSTA